MRLTHLVLLVSSCSVSVGVAGVSLWQGYAGTCEQIAAVLVALVIAWTLRAIWRSTGPAHEGGDVGQLRPMSDDDRRALLTASPE